jgi:trk system potassium uptake protein TrkA
MALKEVEVEKWIGMSLRQVDLTNRFGIQVIAIKKGANEKYRYIPRADDLLEKGDTVVLIGEMEALMKIES